MADRLHAGPALALVALLTAGGVLAGFVIGVPWLLPLLDAAPAYAAMVMALRSGRRAAAVGLMIWWALWLGLSLVTLTTQWPGRAEAVILNGAAYRDEMFSWISTGAGRESTPSLFVPQHLLHAATFCALALLTAGTASILMGAALMGYMGFYVGSLIHRCAGTPLNGLAVLLGWNPWSMVRVASFVILGVVLSEPILSRARGAWPDPRGRLRWLAAAAAGLLLDLLLKTLLAPLWPGLLSGCLG